MPTYERETRIRAPFEAVVGFHSRIEGLEALTPDWLCLRVGSVAGPDGGSDELVEGTTVRLSVRPFGVGPRRAWTSEIVERGERSGAAYFRDAMREGPFPRWVHTHNFYADGDETVVRDVVEYVLPGGDLGRSLGPLSVVGFEPVFRYRHRRTRELLGGRRE